MSGDSTGTGAQPSHPPWPVPGVLLGRGRYRLLSEVSRYDQDDVRLWQGRDLVLDRDVALTLFIAAPHNLGAARMIRSAVGRALRSARLEADGAARVLDVLEPESGTGPTVAVVVAEWTAGGPLVGLTDGGLPPPSVAARVLIPLADAVDAAHNAGLILGCDHPDRIRVSADLQARFAFPGPLPACGPRDDICGLGAMLYLLLTGYWPLPGGPRALPPAPRQADGSPVSPATLRPEVPVELATLALRSLAGPGTTGGVHTGAAVREVLELAAAQDIDGSAGFQRPVDAGQARRQRQVKLRVSMTVLSAAALLIVGYGGMQVLSVFTNAGGTPLVVAGTTPGTAQPASPSGPSSPAQVTYLSVYDPSGKGSPDHQRDVGKLLDGNPSTGWSTDSYRQQFPAYKKGLGVMLSFEGPISAAAVTLTSPSPGTVVEIRTAPSVGADLDETTLVGTATLRRGSTQIPLRAAPATRHLLVWITELAGAGDRNQSKLSEVGVQRRAT